MRVGGRGLAEENCECVFVSIWMYALRMGEEIHLLGEEGLYIPTGVPAWRRNCRAAVTA